MERTETFSERVLDGLHQVYCGMHGHDNLLQFESDRMCLKCMSCGHETPGWQLDEAPPTLRLQGNANHYALAHLIGVRRIA